MNYIPVLELIAKLLTIAIGELALIAIAILLLTRAVVLAMKAVVLNK